MRRHPAAVPLGVVTGLVVVLAATGVLPRWSGLVHAVALPPLDLGFDLRVLVARAPSWPLFLIGVAVAVFVRALVLAFIARALEGTGAPLRFWSACALYAVAAPILTLAAGLEFAALASVYAWYAYVGIGLAILAAFALMPVVLTWVGRTEPAGIALVRANRARLAPTVFLYLGALTLLGAVTVSSSWPVTVAASAALTYAALLAGRRRAITLRPLRRTIAIAAAAVVIVSAAVAFALWPTSSTGPDVVRQGSALLLVPGVDTESGFGALYRFDPSAIGFRCERVYYYSYRGPGPEVGPERGEARCPLQRHLEYERADTERPLADLVEAFDAHLRSIEDATGGAPVVVVTHSQGAWIAWRALSEGGAKGVSDLFMLAPATRTPVAYPPPGRNGEGRVGADLLRALSALSRRLGTSTFDPDAPLSREMLAVADALDALFSRPIPPSVEHAVLIAALDAPVQPEPLFPLGPLTGVTTTHVGITESEEALAILRASLAELSWPNVSVTSGVLRVVVPSFMPPPAGV